MHRHGYKGKKLGRKRDQRRALWRGLAKSLIEHGSIETTLAKAKFLVPEFEKLITEAKKDTLASRRRVISKLDSQLAAQLLIDVITPQLTQRTSGHLRVERTDVRVGDNAQMAVVEFVDPVDYDFDPSAKDKLPAATAEQAKAKKAEIEPEVKKETDKAKKDEAK